MKSVLQVRFVKFKQTLPNDLRQVVRTLVFFSLYPVRWLGVRSLARGKLSGRTLLAKRDNLPDTTRVTEVTPPAYPVGKRGVRHLTDDDTLPAKRAVDTRFVMFDITDQKHSFRNHHLVTPERYIVYEDKVGFRDLPASVDRLETTRHVRGTVAYLSNTWIDNYFHWMCLALPLMMFYRYYLGHDPDFYYVGSPLKSWHYESLEYFGVAPERVLSGGVTADRLLTVVPDRRGATDEAFFAFVRQHMVPEPPPTPSRRLFIGRGEHAKSRKLLNEAACARLLERYGFEYMTMDGLSIADEIELFGSASAVVTTHGAVLTNLLYASSDIDVLDIVPYGAQHPSFADFYDMCHFLNCGYGMIWGEKIPAQSGRRDTEVDVYVDLEKLEQAVVSLLGAQSARSQVESERQDGVIKDKQAKQAWSQNALINS